MRRITLSAVAIVSGLAVAAPTFAATDANRLTGTDGPGSTITMSKKTVKSGTYKIVIRDRSSIHNFHLTGPGVNKKTSVARGRHDDLDREAEERHLQVRLRPARLDHARTTEGQMRRET